MLDNNLPPAPAKALNALSEKEDHEVAHLTEKFPRDTPGIQWIQTFRDEGGWIIISQDQFRKSDLDKRALRECRGDCFLLGKALGHNKVLG